MHTPSADSARQLTQAVLLAWLCHRYHDLATYASESLKQRIHFLAKPDGSNLQDLFIWDPPSSSTTTPTSTSTSASSTALSWSSAQIQEFIQRHWSADQLPLNPPHPHSSWDAVPVYCRELDPETLHAIVALGQQDHATVAVVLAVVKDHHASNEGDKAPYWRYHNMVVMHESELQSSQGWYPSSEWMTLQRDSMASNDSLEAAPVKHEQGHGSDPAEDEDSDDDYWGQYNDSEDDDGDSSAAAAATATAGDTVHATTGAKTTMDDKDKDNGGNGNDGDDDEDDDDEYWRKYAEQQEQHDRDERKKKMQQSSAQIPLESTTITTDHEDRSPLASSIHSSTTIQESTTLNSLGASASSFSSTRPGQLDPTMLSSLMQMLVAQGMDQSSSSPSSTQLPSTTTTTTTLPSSAPNVVAHPDPDPRSKSRIIESMRSIVQDCHRAGFSKDEIFEMMQSAYSTSHLLAE